MKKIFSKGIIIFGLLIIFVGIVILGAMLNSPKPAEIKSEQATLTHFREVNSHSVSDESLNGEAESNITLDRGEDGSYKPQKVYKSDIITSKFSFCAIGSHWQEDLPQGTNLVLEVKSYDGLTWSPWYKVERLEDFPDDRGIQFQGQVPGNLVFVEGGQAIQYKITLSSEDGRNTPCLKQIDLTYIDSTSGPDPVSNKIGSTQKTQAASSPSIISRAQWGCNESLRNWDPEYRSTEKIIIHHTAGTNNPSNPAATVRAIYYYHAVSLGWGDIGYNFLIDQHGNIYEGRYGGNNVVAGHAYHYNYGTCGISLLGNFVNTDPSGAAVNSLVDLTAFKCNQNNIDPQGSSDFRRSDGPIHYGLPNIIGHRDVGATACPGNRLHARLGEIRQRAKDKVLDLQWISQSDYPSLTPGEETTLQVKFKNTSGETWYNYGSNPVRLGTSHPIDRDSAFYTSDWICKDRPTNMDQAEVKSGEIATFTFKIKTPLTSGIYREYFQVVCEWKKWLSDVGLYWDIEVKPGLKWIRQSDYPTIVPGEKKTLWVEFENIGEIPWDKSGSNPVRLGTSKPCDRDSIFHDDSWISNNRACTFTNVSNPSSSTILPGQTARFTFTVSAPFMPGVHREYFQVVCEHKTWLSDPGLYWDITVEQLRFDTQWISQSDYLTLETGESADCWVEFRNTGNITWKNYGEHPINLGTENPQDRDSLFFTQGEWINPQRPCKLLQAEVKPGEVGRFNFTVTAPSTHGLFKEYFNPVCEWVDWFNNNHGFYLQFTVVPDLQNQWIAQSEYLALTPNQKTTLWVEFKNTGNSPWDKSGSNPVRLGTSKPCDRNSIFHDDSWVSNNRACTFTNVSNPSLNIVLPGQTARFTFTVSTPSIPGIYREYFQLVSEYQTWLNDVGLYWDITVGNGQPNIRVGLYNTHDSIVVTGNGSYQICDFNNSPLVTLGPGQTATVSGRYNVQCSNGYSSSNSTPFRIRPLGSTILEIQNYYRPGWGGRNDNRYRGLIEYRWSDVEGTYWVINEVTLEDYLYGLAEEPNWWPKEALKAHIVGARGYAFYNIHHPKSTCSRNFFHVFSDWRSQTYKGYAYEQAIGSPNYLKESACETFGQIIYYGNEVALVPYHSDCGGHTSDYPDKPYLKSVYCPYSQGHSRSGHGWGLCMTGVKGFADSGRGYIDILKHYLTGVDIRKAY